MHSASERIKFLNDLSEFLEVSKRNLAEYLEKIAVGYKAVPERKETLLVCPLDRNHRVHQTNMKKHLQRCKLRQLGIKGYAYKNLPLSSHYYYQKSTSVVPVLFGESDLASLGIEFKGFMQVPEDSQLKQKDILVSGKGFKSHAQNDISTKFHNLGDELRYIYSWHAVPSQYQSFDERVLCTGDVKKWITKYLERSSIGAGLSDLSPLEEFIYSSLQDPALRHPDGLQTCMKEIMGNDADYFVLELWKELHSLSLCFKHNISQFDLETAKQRVSASVSKTPIFVEATRNIPIPVDVVSALVSSENRLKIYEHVLKVVEGTKKEREITFEDLKNETEMQLRAAALLEENRQVDKKRSHLEIIAELRDFKRRRQSYRAKNTHITRRSATEVLRDLIEDQMRYLELMSGRDDSNRDDESRDDDNQVRLLNYVQQKTADKIEEPSTLQPVETYVNQTEREDIEGNRKESLHTDERPGINTGTEDTTEETRRRESKSYKSKSRSHRHEESRRKRSRERKRDRHRSRSRDRKRYREKSRSRDYDRR